MLSLVDYNNSILRINTAAVKFPLSTEDIQIIQNMKYSIQPAQLKQSNAAFASVAGMAANQWGLNKKIFLFCPVGDSVNNLEVIINPSYEPIDDRQACAWEGCFSVPLTAGYVRRYVHIKITYQNEDGKFIFKELHNWPARVWQHENDHLNGILYDDVKAGKCVDKKQFSSKEELWKFYKAKKEEQIKLSSSFKPNATNT